MQGPGPQEQMQGLGLQGQSQVTGGQNLGVCWGCHQTGHIRSNCPTNPWLGPAAGWQEEGCPEESEIYKEIYCPHLKSA